MRRIHSHRTHEQNQDHRPSRHAGALAAGPRAMSADTLVERVARLLSAQAAADDWRGFVPHARAVLMAVRAPTRGMAKAGADIPVGCCMTNASDAGEVWEYMIDAALAEDLVLQA